MNIRNAIAEFDRAALAETLAAAEEQRQQVLKLFPLEEWPSLPLSRYALGLGADGDDVTYCRLLEFNTPALGSISGGSAIKHMIYRHNSGEWRLAANLRGMDVEDAWVRLRGEFAAALEAVGRGDFSVLDDLPVLQSGQALATKTLSVYYPDQFLPIASGSHLRAFVQALGGTPERNAPAWRVNRHLRDIVAADPELAQWHPIEVMHFLYSEFDPRPEKRTVWKIAPGRNASFWDECLSGGYICVEWDEVGDLAQYTSDTELKFALDSYWPRTAGGNLVKARNLLAYRDLQPGDRVVANLGMTHILAIGTVTEGYRFDESRALAKHVVPVAWDTRYEQDLPEPQRAWVPTFAKVSEQLFSQFLRMGDLAESEALEVPVPEDVSQLLAVLDRKKQAILHGPPGTGKTRLALSAALAVDGRAASIDTPDRGSAIAKMLADGRIQLVTFHPSYGYEDFVEGYKPVHDAAATGLRLALTDGLFHDLCTAAAKDRDHVYLLIIDEINRGDLPRIFGELITLLESDKRGIEVQLSISKRRFAVPANVRIIGTMNTADRSVSHLDAAIRRRFGFVYVGPDPDALSGAIGPLELSAFLTSLNGRIAECLDTDHQIGHAYLLCDSEPLATDEELFTAYYHDIVPLLEDYCVGRAELLRQILGGLVDQDTGRPAQVAVQDLASALAAEFLAGGEAS
ncbi:AAA domain-containing protein [Nocardia sp. ET3-3]|uniref:AAA domain-containing protein n=1 Tax=Nocardia terrae TaxID=2675851 RepID=A0A7K1V890_9NOCA|nr:AAA family ATPase [Nocardia terrae]MVU82298.1 AAA domain-containing protein [Nocardia terrae]